MCGTVDSVSTLLTTVGFAYRPCDRGERRLDARHAALALERLEQRRSPRRRCTRPAPRCTTMSRSKPEPRMFLPRKPLACASAIACVEPLVAERELAAQVDEREVALDRERRDDDALDELVRIALDEHAVLERRRLAFVAVHHEVARERVGRQERPLLRRSGSRRRRGRAGPTASPAPARRPGRPCASTARSASYAPRRERAVDRPRVVGTLVQPLGDDPRLGARPSVSTGAPEIVRAVRAPACTPRRSSSRRSGVSCSWNS